MAKQKKVIQPKPKVVENNRSTIRILKVLVFILPVIIYLNTLKNGYVLDDFSVIKENWVVKDGVKSVPLIFKTSYRYGYWGNTDELYRPLSLVMFAAEWQLWPDSPAQAHFINILIYALCCLLLFNFLRKALARSNLILPFIITLLFALHPIHTEVVSNIKSRDELLSFLFLLMTIIVMFRYVNTGKIAQLVLAVIFYFLAFLSKESAITFLAVFPLVLYFFTTNTRKRGIIFCLVMVVPALIFLVIRQKVIGEALETSTVSIADNLLVGAPDAITRFATAIKIMGLYLWKLILPHPLASDYSFNQIPIVGFSNPLALIGLVLHGGLVYFAVKLFRKKHLLAFAILFYFITMSLYSNLVITIGSSFGERFLFVPSIAFAIALAVGIGYFMRNEISDVEVNKPGIWFSKYKKLLYIVIPILVLYSLKTIIRNKEWESNLTLYTADVKKSPESAHMRYYYGLVLMKDLAMGGGNTVTKPQYLDSAIVEFSAAARIIPTYADAYDQLGLAYYRKNDFDKALVNYEKAIQYNPQKSITYSNMGVIYFNKGNLDKALDSYQKAVKYNPAFSDAWLNLGSTYGMMGKFRESVDAFLQCVRYDPGNATANYFLGISYQSLGDSLNAMKYINIAKKLDPSVGANSK
jgi:tetratricopeptide (TPR) repeat protein